MGSAGKAVWVAVGASVLGAALGFAAGAWWRGGRPAREVHASPAEMAPAPAPQSMTAQPERQESTEQASDAADGSTVDPER